MKKIRVNGVWRETQAEELEAALRELGYGEAVVATALNEQFVPCAARRAAALNDGDRLEVLAPMQGG